MLLLFQDTGRRRIGPIGEQILMKVAVTKDKDTLKLTIGSTTATKNNQRMQLEAAPVIVKGNTLVPLRFISEHFGHWVSWNGQTKTASIESKKTFTTQYGQLTLHKKPNRIVSVIPADLEILYAIGAGDLAVGRSTSQGAVYPSQAKSLTEVGTSHSIDFEKLASLKADLVIGHGRLNAKDKRTTIYLCR